MHSGVPANIVFLLTGTVHVNNRQFTALTDPLTRRAQYVATIRYHLAEYPCPIVFVENSGVDLSPDFPEAIAAGRLEILYFEGNDYPAHLGKGLGEMRCLEFAIRQSKLLRDEHFIFKITGRYRIANLPSFIRRYQRRPQLAVMADLTNNFRHSVSSITGFKKFFAEQYLFPQAHLLNDEENYFFETALARAVLLAIADHVEFEIFRPYPKLVAISGTTGKPYKKSFLYMLPRQLKYLVRYFIVMR